jgi:hypothetical protein
VSVEPKAPAVVVGVEVGVNMYVGAAEVHHLPSGSFYS